MRTASTDPYWTFDGPVVRGVGFDQAQIKLATLDYSAYQPTGAYLAPARTDPGH